MDYFIVDANLIAFAVDGEDFNAWFNLEHVPQVVDIYAQRATIEIIIHSPNLAEDIAAFNELIAVVHEDSEQLGFFS